MPASSRLLISPGTTYLPPTIYLNAEERRLIGTYLATMYRQPNFGYLIANSSYYYDHITASPEAAENHLPFLPGLSWLKRFPAI